MDFKEWRDFVGNIMAGIFGGLVVLAWSLIYEIVREKSLPWIILGPLIGSLVLFFIIIFVLRFLLLDKK